MTEVADCVDRMIQFKQRNPGAEFDLTQFLFTARVPGHDGPFRAMSLCTLMDTVERWAAEQTMARLLFGARAAEREGRPMIVYLCSCGFATDDPDWFDGHLDEHPGHHQQRRVRDSPASSPTP